MPGSLVCWFTKVHGFRRQETSCLQSFLATYLSLSLSFARVVVVGVLRVGSSYEQLTLRFFSRTFNVSAWCTLVSAASSGSFWSWSPWKHRDERARWIEEGKGGRGWGAGWFRRVWSFLKGKKTGKDGVPTVWTNFILGGRAKGKLPVRILLREQCAHDNARFGL